MFKPRPRRKLSVRVKGIINDAKVKGWLATPIKYEVRNPNGDWSPFMTAYEDQRWGSWDSDCCWALATLNTVAIGLEWLWTNHMFSEEAMNFFTKNGYIDPAGNFALSEMFIEILGGNKMNGGTAEEAAQLIQKYGFIPRSMLVYSMARSQACLNEDQFAADYFNTAQITQAMKDLGQKARTYVNVAYQRIGNSYKTPDLATYQAALKFAPCALGLPIPADVSQWNAPVVQYDGGTVMAHETCGYAMTPRNEYNILDQYNPFEKTLSPNYFIPSCIQVILYATPAVKPNPVYQPPTNNMWTAFFNWLNGALSSFRFD